MQNPSFQNVQVHPQLFVSPVMQTGMDGYADNNSSGDPQYVQYSPPNTSSNVYPQQSNLHQPVLDSQVPQINQDFSTNNQPPLMTSNNRFTEQSGGQQPYSDDGNNNANARNAIICCCGCGTIIVIVFAVLGTILGPATGFGYVLYAVVPIGLCMMCCGCLACFALSNQGPKYQAM